MNAVVAPRVAVVTGIAPHSLGEAFLRDYAALGNPTPVVGIDRVRNLSLEKSPSYYGIELDLNPITGAGGLTTFAREVRRALEGAVNGAVDCLVQSAGVYDSGEILEHDVQRRQRLLGVNLVGHVELLHAVMALNVQRGVKNSDFLSYVEVGSFQGLRARGGRAIYAASKAAGIDLCSALLDGHEVLRSIYFAPAAIDTHMLHRNHWVHKARGAQALFDQILHSDLSLYHAVFIDCDEEAFRRAVSVSGERLDLALGNFKAYVAVREETKHGELGLLSADVCAKMLLSLVTQPAIHSSGVYLASCAARSGPSLCFARFADLDRLQRLQEVGQLVRWE